MSTGPLGAAAMFTALRPFLAPYRGRIALAAIALLAAAGAALAIPLAFRQLIDRGFGGSVADAMPTAGSMDGAFIALFVVALVLALATAARFYLVSWLGERVTTDLRSAVYSRVLHQDPRFFETLRPGEVLSRLGTDTALVQTLIGTSVSMGLRNMVLFGGGLVMLVVTSARLASIIIGLLVLVVLPILVFGRRVRRLSRASQDRAAETSAMAGESLGGIQVVQAYARERHESQRFDRANEAAFASAIRRVRARSALTALAITLVFGAIVFVLWLGAHAVLEGRMTNGLLMQFVLYAAIVGGAAAAIAEVFGDVQRAAGATERLLELLQAQPSIVAPAEPRRLPALTGPSAERRMASIGNPADVGAGRGYGAAIEFEQVVFSYPSRPAERALDDVDLRVASGETVAIVGPSGAGKSTLFHLLLRFHDPQRGVIRFEGVDLRELDPGELRQRIGLVSQDNVIFSADVIDNIRYGRLEASDEEVFAAARAARVDEFVARLPQGWNTDLGERGLRLSGGQRQRVSIARALLRDPPLLLLDEATSALDAESERAVQEALETAMSGRTTLVIAHRLATIVHADRIVVMDHGRIVEAGTHAELVEARGLYARLAALQFGVERVDEDPHASVTTIDWRTQA